MQYRIEIAKQARLLELYADLNLERRHTIQLGSNPTRDKATEGDGATPEGEFYICAKNARSKFYLSLCISYPNAAAAERGLRHGLIDSQQHAQILQAVRSQTIPPQHTRLGGEIYIHGHPVGGETGNTPRDWTRGCIAIDNEAMQGLYERVSLGTPVIIRP